MIRIGISGWTYPPWRGTFYPAGLPHRRELAYAAERMTSIEVNGTFYSLQRPTSFRSWYAATPPGFVLAVKGPRFLTHMKKLIDPDGPLATFFASGVLGLADKLGPVLWQLPPTLGFRHDRIADFLAKLPRTQAEAVELAHRDERLAPDRVWLATPVPEQPVRHALEVRHDSFRDPRLLDLLRAHGVALVTADTAGRWPQIEELTTDFAYVRLHGAQELYVSGYDGPALDTWAGKLAAWSNQGADVYCYFDNDVKVRAPVDAMALIARLGPPRS